MRDLMDAVVGTKLKVPERYSSAFTVREVQSVTKTQVKCGNGDAFRKKDGLLLGSGASGRHSIYASIASSEDILKSKIRIVQRRVIGIKVTAENIERVLALIAESK